MTAETIRQTLQQTTGNISLSARSVWTCLAEKVDFTLSRPQASPGIIVNQLSGREGKYFVLKNPEAKTYFRLSDKEYFLWQQMDGNHTVKELVVAYFMEYKVLAFGRVGVLLEGLKNKYFLTEKPVNVYQQIRTGLNQHSPQARITGLGKLLIEKQFAIQGLDKPLTSLYQRFAWLFFTMPANILWMVVAIAGLVFFSQILFENKYGIFTIGGSALLGSISLFVVYQLSIFIHELAHGLAVKHYRREVTSGGFMIYYGMPAFYVDTNDIWMEGKRPRLAVTWAGPYSGLILAGFASLVLYLCPQFRLNPLLFQFASVSYLVVLLNLNPLLELDGYFLLMDSIEIPMLRRKSLEFIRHGVWVKLKNLNVSGIKFWLCFKEFSREERIFTVFGLLSAIWSVYSIAEAIFIWQLRITSTVSPIFLQSGAAVRVAILIGAALLGLALLICGGFIMVAWVRRLVILATRAGFFATPWRKATWVMFVILGVGFACLVFPPVSPWIGLAALTLAVYFSTCNARDYSGSHFAKVFWLMSATCLVLWLAETIKLAVSTILSRAGSLDGAADWSRGIALIFLFSAGLLLLAGENFKRLSAAGKIFMAIGIFTGLVCMSTVVIQFGGEARADQIILKVLRWFPLISLCFLFPTMLSFWHTSTGPAAAIIGLGLVALLGAMLLDIPSVWAYLCLAGGFGLQQAAYQRKVRLHGSKLEFSQAHSDHDFLKLAFHWTVLGLDEQLFESAGKRQASIIEGQFNQFAAAAGWQIQVHGDHVADDLPSTASLRQLGNTYASALTLFLDLLAGHMGEKMTIRALQRVYDILPWETREIACQYLFPEVRRAQGLNQQFKVTQQTYHALLQRNLLFAALSPEEIDHLCSCLQAEKYKPGQVIIRQGESGDKFYIIAMGSVDIEVRNARGVTEVVNHLGRGDYFGEVALLKDTPRNATCRAAIPTEILSLSRTDFNNMVKGCFEMREKLQSSISRVNMLRHIPIFSEMDDKQLNLIASHMSEVCFEPGEIVIRQGEIGDIFYIIESGWVKVFVNTEGCDTLVAELGPGEYFGEIALLSQNPRNASVRVSTSTSLLALEKSDFERLVVPHLYASRVLEQEVSRRIMITRRASLSQLNLQPSSGVT